MELFDKITQIDGQLLIGIQHALNADFLTPIMKGITFLGEVGWFFVLCTLIMLAIRGTRGCGIVCAISQLANFIICNLCLKPLFNRTRPWVTFAEVNRLLPDPGDASFPSGHAAIAFSFAMALFFATMPLVVDGVKNWNEGRFEIGWKGVNANRQTLHRCGIVCIILALLVALSRLYLGMHYPTDVLAGCIVGTLSAQLACAIYLRILHRKGK